MAATAFDNVIRFPDGAQFPKLPSEKILTESRDLVARRLREALRAVLDKVAEELQQRGDTAADREQRLFYYQLNNVVSAAGGRLEAKLAAHWVREFDAAASGRGSRTAEISSDKLKIVDDEELNLELALKSMAQSLHDKCEDNLYGITQRIGALSGKENAGDDDNPASPEVLTKALDGALRELEFDGPSRLELLRCIQIHVDHLAPIYHELNANLVRHKVLPNLKRGYIKQPTFAPRKAGVEAPGDDVFAALQKALAAPGGVEAGRVASFANAMPGAGVAGVGLSSGLTGGATPYARGEQVWTTLDSLQRVTPAAALGVSGEVPAAAANILHEFRAGEVGQTLTQLDAITVDIVAMLFDMIFDDKEISDPIKALVGKLQIPVLKVAMIDKSFFSSRAHPTRRLIELIARTAVRWGREIDRDDPIYRKIAAIIDKVQAEFKQDTVLFDSMCAELESFLAEQEQLADARAMRAASLVAQREQEEIAALVVDDAIRSWLAGPLPAPVADLIRHEWRDYLMYVWMESGGASEVWEAAVNTVADLVGSVQPKPDVQTRRALARQLPALVKRLSCAFDSIRVAAERRHRVFDGLFTLHAGVLRGGEAPPELQPPAEPAVASAATEPVIASTPLVDGEITVDSISLSAAAADDAAGRCVEGLQRGEWVEFSQADGSAARYRLSWISPRRGIMLFTNPLSPRAVAVSPEALALQVERGGARLLEAEPIFDRVVGKALESLQAA